MVISLSNPIAGKFYSLAFGLNAIQLTIGDATTREWNNSTGTGLWTTGGNWIGGVAPNTIGESAKFGTASAGGTVNLNGNKTVSGLIFDNGAGYTLSGTASTLTLNNGVAAAAIAVNNGSHTIAVPLTMSSAASVSFANPGTSLTITGAIDGGIGPVAKPVSISGSGTMTFTSDNTYGTTTLLNGATLNLGTFGGSDAHGSLGLGDVTMSGGSTLNINRSGVLIFGGNVTGSGDSAGSVNQLGTSNTTIAGAITNVSTVNVSAGSLAVGGVINQTSGVVVTGGNLNAFGITGSGGLTVSGGGAGLAGTNSYSGGTMISGGTIILAGTGTSLPANSMLAVNGGTLDLRGNNVSLSAVTDLPTSTGVITNNGAGTSTITFAGFQANADIYAALKDGAGGGKVALNTGIDNTVGGNVWTLHLHSPGTYSGGTTVLKQSIEADASNAFGTGPITVALNNSSINTSQIFLAGGVTIPNNITIAQANPGTGGGAIQQVLTTAGSSTLSGTITIQADNLNGGLFVGPTVGGVDFMNVTGPVNVAGTATTIIQRNGNVMYSGGGNYPSLQITGLAQLRRNNGLGQSSIVQLAISGNGTFDLNGFDQTAVALSATTTNQAIVQNSGAGTNTLTLNTKGNNTYNGAINGNINLTIAGTGRQILSGFNSYTGNTRINSGTLQLGADSAVSGTSSLILAGGTFATDGHIQTFFAPLSLLANSTIDLGAGASIVQFSDSHTQTWTAGALLRVSNWSGNITGSGTDQLLVGDSTKTGLSAAQLSRIHFSGFHTGAAFVVNGASGELVPANTTPLLRGDLNQDNHVNASDVTAMLTALTDINAYKAAHPTLDTFEASDILDVDQDGIVSNADLQGLLTTLKNGGGSVAPVPEPASVLLLLSGILAISSRWRKRPF